jgi:hypothetical protein
LAVRATSGRQPDRRIRRIPIKHGTFLQTT